MDKKIDTGLSCLVMIAKYHGIAADAEQIRHAFAIGSDGMRTIDILRAGKELGFKAKAATVKYERLQKLPMPVMVEVNTPHLTPTPTLLHEGGGSEGQGEREGEGVRGNNEKQYVILAKIENEQVLILHPAENKPRILKRDEFLDLWTGDALHPDPLPKGEREDRQDKNVLPIDRRGSLTMQKGNVILFARREMKALTGEGFGIKWFIPAVWKYKKPLLDVLTASFVLQIFALITPLFTQVVIDKVLVHRGLTTLDVLAIGLLAIALFEAVLNVLRTYVFTHTTSRIDVVLSTRLFKHLLSLPLRYFEVRRVGDTVARVRELENIRHFLTGAPLTSVLDVMFMAVFIAVMFFYSTALTLVALGTLVLAH